AQNFELVVLIRPQNLLIEPLGDLSLTWLRGHNAKLTLAARLLSALAHKLGTRSLFKGDNRHLAEPHRLPLRQLGHSRLATHTGHDAVRDLLRQHHGIRRAENSHG